MMMIPPVRIELTFPAQSTRCPVHWTTGVHKAPGAVTPGAMLSHYGFLAQLRPAGRFLAPQPLPCSIGYSSLTRNTIIDYYRLQGRARMQTFEMPEDLPEEVPIDDAVEDIASCLSHMIDDLPERYRQAITLTEYDGLSQRGISEQLGLSLSGAKSRIQRARGKLKDMLLECCHFEFDRLGHIIDYQSKEPSCRYCPISCSEG